MTQVSVYIRAQQGDQSLLHEFDGLTYEEKSRCVALAAQFGQAALLKALIEYGIEPFAEHALWVAAHDAQFETVELLTPLVPTDKVVWESVLRYAIKNNHTSLQNTILAFNPAVNVNSSLAVAARNERKEMMTSLLQRATEMTSAVAVDMLLKQWTDLLYQHFDLLPSVEKNTLFVYCVRHQDQEQTRMLELCKEHLFYASPNALATAVENQDWVLAEKLLAYCDVNAAVKLINKKNPNQATRTQLQRLVLLHEVGDIGESTVKRKM